MNARQFVLVLAGLLIPPTDDKRDRDNPKYREWEAELARDLKARGMRCPIIVMREGKLYRVLAGETRRRAAMICGMQQVPVVILDRPLSRAEQLQEQLLENMMRKDMSDLELAELFIALMQENKWTQAQLAKHLQLKPARVSKILRIFNRLPEDLRAQVGHGADKIGPSIAYLISQFPDHDSMRREAAEVLGGGVDRNELISRLSKARGRQVKDNSTRNLKHHGAKLAIPASWGPEQIKELATWLMHLDLGDSGKAA